MGPVNMDRHWDVVIAAVGISLGGLLAGWVGLACATVAVIAIGVRRGGSVGGAAALVVFCGSVSVTHYGFGSPEWTESQDRLWVAATLLTAVVVLLMSAWRVDRSVRAATAVTFAAVATALLVDSTTSIRLTSAVVVAVIAAFVTTSLAPRYADLRLEPKLIRTLVDFTLATGVVLDATHELIGGFGGRGPSRFGVQRWIGTTVDPNEFGELALLALGLSLVIATPPVRKDRFTSAKGLALALRIVAYVAVLVASGSRTALALAIGVVVVAGLRSLRTRLLVPALLGLALVVGVAVASLSVDQLSLSGVQDVENVSAFNGRAEIWDLALGERTGNPVRALGFGNTELYFAELYSSARPIPWENISAHNRVIEAWAALGLHGAILLVATFGYVLVRSIRAGATSLAVVSATIASSMMLPGFGSLRPGAWLLVPFALMAHAATSDSDLYRT